MITRKAGHLRRATTEPTHLSGKPCSQIFENFGDFYAETASPLMLLQRQQQHRLAEAQGVHGSGWLHVPWPQEDTAYATLWRAHGHAQTTQQPGSKRREGFQSTHPAVALVGERFVPVRHVPCLHLCRLKNKRASSEQTRRRRALGIIRRGRTSTNVVSVALTTTVPNVGA